jgi:N-acetyltransferase 10
MMLKASDTDWLVSLYLDFSQRFQRLLSGPFRVLTAELALSLISCTSPPTEQNVDIAHFLTPYDVKRLRAYARGETDYHLITDLLPVVADLLFNKLSFSGSNSFLAKRVLVGMGSQRKTIDELFLEDMNRISIPQILGILKPSVDKISAQLEKKLEAKIKDQYNQRKCKNITLASDSGNSEVPKKQRLD